MSADAGDDGRATAAAATVDGRNRKQPRQDQHRHRQPPPSSSSSSSRVAHGASRESLWDALASRFRTSTTKPTPAPAAERITTPTSAASSVTSAAAANKVRGHGRKRNRKPRTTADSSSTTATESWRTSVEPGSSPTSARWTAGPTTTVPPSPRASVATTARPTSQTTSPMRSSSSSASSSALPAFRTGPHNFLPTAASADEPSNDTRHSVDELLLASTSAMPSVVEHRQHHLGPRVINVTIYPQVAVEAVVVPILTSMFAFPVLAFTLICLLRRRAQRLRKAEPRNRALRVNTSFSPSRARAKTSGSTPGTPAPYGLLGKTASCLPAIIVEPPIITAAGFGMSNNGYGNNNNNKNKKKNEDESGGGGGKSLKFTPPSTPHSSSTTTDPAPQTNGGGGGGRHPSSVRFDVDVCVESSATTAIAVPAVFAIDSPESTRHQQQQQLNSKNGEDSGVCCSMPRESFSSAGGPDVEQTEPAAGHEDPKHDDGSEPRAAEETEQDEGITGGGEEEDEAGEMRTPCLLSFTESGKMAAAMLNVQMVDKITVTGGSDEGSNGSNSDSCKETSSNEEEEEEEEDSDQAVTVLLEPPAEFADAVLNGESGRVEGNEDPRHPDATSSPEQDQDQFRRQLSGSEARPNSPTTVPDAGCGNADDALLISTVLRTTPATSTASGCRVIEVCIPPSASASASDDDTSAAHAGRRRYVQHCSETDTDVEEGSERILAPVPRPPAARVVSKGVQVTDVRIRNTLSGAGHQQQQQHRHQKNRTGGSELGRTRLANGSVVTFARRTVAEVADPCPKTSGAVEQQQKCAVTFLGGDRSEVISEVRTNMALRSMQQQQPASPSSQTSPWIPRTDSGLTFNNAVVYPSANSSSRGGKRARFAH